MEVKKQRPEMLDMNIFPAAGQVRSSSPKSVSIYLSLSIYIYMAIVENPLTKTLDKIIYPPGAFRPDGKR